MSIAITFVLGVVAGAIGLHLVAAKNPTVKL
jgi:hypothetical protein